MDLKTLVRSLRSGHCLFLKEVFDPSVEFEVEFFKRAKKRKTKCLYIGPKKRWKQIADCLGPKSILFYDRPDAFYLENGVFDKNAICTKWRSIARDCPRNGYSGLSVVSELYYLGSRVPLTDLISYETEVHVELAGLPITAVCVYSMESLSPEDFEVLRLHHGEVVLKVDDGSYCLVSNLARDNLALLLQETVKHKALAVRRNKEIVLVNELLRTALLETINLQTIFETQGWGSLIGTLLSRVVSFIGAIAAVLCLEVEGEGFIVGSSIGLSEEKQESLKKLAYDHRTVSLAAPINDSSSSTSDISGSTAIRLDGEIAVTLLGKDLLGDGSREVFLFKPSFDDGSPRFMIVVFDADDLLAPVSNLISQELLDTLFSCFIAAIKAQRESSRYAVKRALEVKLRVASLVNQSIRHEINNILQVISGNAQLLMLRGLKGARAGEILNKILSAVREASAVTNRMNQLTRIDGIRSLTPVNLCKAVRDAAWVFESNSKSNSKFKAERDEGRNPRHVILRVDTSGNLMVMADRVELEAAIVSLTTSVAKGMPEGGNIIISVEEAVDGRASLTVLGDSPGLSLEEPDETPNLSVTESSTNRTKFWLGITRQIVSDYGGEMEVSNKPDGSPFITVRLPVLRT